MSFVALILVVILLIWSLALAYKERSRKVTIRGRLAALRRKVESLPDGTDEEKSKKEILYRELFLEYLENILGEVESLKTKAGSKPDSAKKRKTSRKKK